MYSVIEKQGINYNKFRKVIMDTDALVAGSAALALYMDQEGMFRTWAPRDIDIFVWHSKQGRIHSLLIQSGYKNITGEEKRYYKLDGRLVVTTYYKEGCTLVQVIGVTSTPNMRKFIKAHFDLNICMTYWNPYTHMFEAVDAYNTKRREIDALNPKKGIDRRITKYVQRGFYFY